MKGVILLLGASLVLGSCGLSEQSVEASIPEGVVITAPSHYLMVGDTFFADVYPLAVGDWSSELTFRTDDSTISSKWVDGKLKIAVPAYEVGIKNIKGSLGFSKVKAPALEIKESFIVAQRTVVVTSSILLKDQPNEIEVAVQGYPPFFEFKVEHAEIEGSGPKYTITPHLTGPLTIYILERETGVELGKREFIVHEEKK